MSMHSATDTHVRTAHAPTSVSRVEVDFGLSMCTLWWHAPSLPPNASSGVAPGRRHRNQARPLGRQRTALRRLARRGRFGVRRQPPHLCEQAAEGLGLWLGKPLQG